MDVPIIRGTQEIQIIIMGEGDFILMTTIRMTIIKTTARWLRVRVWEGQGDVSCAPFCNCAKHGQYFNGPGGGFNGEGGLIIHFGSAPPTLYATAIYYVPRYTL